MKKGFVTKLCCDGWSKVVQFFFLVSVLLFLVKLAVSQCP